MSIKGKAVYVCGKYIEMLRLAHKRQEEEIPLDFHFGLHEVVGEYGDCVIISPITNRLIETRVPRNAVWVIN